MSADRFAQAANANSSGSWNKYAYVSDDPVNLFDPNGTEECKTVDDDGCSDHDDDDDGGGTPSAGLIASVTVTTTSTSDPSDSSDAGDTSDPSDPVGTGSSDPSGLGAGTYNSCVVGSVGVGTAIGSGVGGGVLGGAAWGKDFRSIRWTYTASG
jgi:hypothetical protein